MRPRRKGIALHGNEDEPPRRANPRRRTSFESPATATPQAWPQPARFPRPDPRQPDPRPDARQPVRPAAPEAPPVPDRPRPGVAATTGQHPIARVRGTGGGPHGTAQIPIVRAAPRAPQPDPSLRTPQGATVDPPRRRLRVDPPTLPIRTAPAAAPQRVAAAPVPAPQSGRRAAHPEARTATATRPITRTAPPPPIAPPAEPAVARRRRPLRGAIALLAAAGLLAIYALPSIETAGAPPVAGVHLDDDLQQFQVDSDASMPDAGTDPVSGTMPVVAPTWVVPLRGELRDGFGPRPIQPVAGVSLFHRGQDIGGPCGAAIHAAAAGIVVTSRWWGTYGNWTLIDHGGGVATGYAHQERMVVSVGQHVAADQVIGYEGSTGASTGCHLHLEVHLNGVAVNPVPFFKAKGIPLGE